MIHLRPFTIIFLAIIITVLSGCEQKSTTKIDLSGEWKFQLDTLDQGVEAKWFTQALNGKIILPGSTASNNKGYNPTILTAWTGEIQDSSFFTDNTFAKYRTIENFKIPFWLQPTKVYVGPAWYQKEIEIPVAWKDKPIELFLERCHWESRVWLDEQEIGTQNSLGAPHAYNLTGKATAGKHTLTVRIDNRVKDIVVGSNSHSISDHTQTNWNGIIGEISLFSKSSVFINRIKVTPDIVGKKITATISVTNTTGKPQTGVFDFTVTSADGAGSLPSLQKEITIEVDTQTVEFDYSLGSNMKLWDEFTPHLYTLKIELQANAETDKREVNFGMRALGVSGTNITINNRPTFLRGTLECAIFPKTGYPPTDINEWLRIFKTCKAYGLNHVRFHSWCPPEAAFNAADQVGIYLQIECSSWANTGIGNGEPLDKFIYEESENIVTHFGNHPSFTFFTYGNEPRGDAHEEYLKNFVMHWKQKDQRFLYTAGAGWPLLPENDYHNTFEPRIQGWGEGLASIINSKPPSTNYDWTNITQKWDKPVVSHEIGQWCAYPDFKEIKKYDGVLRAKNFEIFRESLNQNNLGHLADSFLIASGELQKRCYKADIEAALRTPGFGGFQLLDLHDFPGQGTALVGVLNAFWEEKGYVTSQEYRKFCNTTVPLVRLAKQSYHIDEEMSVGVEVAHFGAAPLKNITPSWSIKDTNGKSLFEGTLQNTDIAIGNNIELGIIKQKLSGIASPQKLILNVSVEEFSNDWEIWVYPKSPLSMVEEIHVTNTLDLKALGVLDVGGKVLYILNKGSLLPEKGGDIKIGFSSIFWNTAWTKGQAPHTLGILCDPKHPALKEFPTEFHSNWQWWDAMSHSQPILLKDFPNVKPIVRVIDDWSTNRSLALLFECKIGKGKLLVSSIDLTTNLNERIPARQLLYSLKRYMASDAFSPTVAMDIDKIKSLTK